MSVLVVSYIDFYTQQRRSNRLLFVRTVGRLPDRKCDRLVVCLGQRFVINYVFNIVHMRWFHPIEQMEKFAKGRLVPLILDRLQQSNANGASKVASMSWYAFQTMVASFVLYLGRDYVALSIDTAKSPWAPEPSTDSSNGTPVSDSAERPKDALDSQKLAIT